MPLPNGDTIVYLTRISRGANMFHISSGFCNGQMTLFRGSRIVHQDIAVSYAWIVKYRNIDIPFNIRIVVTGINFAVDIVNPTKYRNIKSKIAKYRDIVEIYWGHSSGSLLGGHNAQLP